MGRPQSLDGGIVVAFKAAYTADEATRMGPITRGAAALTQVFCPAATTNPLIPALRSDPIALSGASRRKQTPSSHAEAFTTD
jgi:hypothetical protein